MKPTIALDIDDVLVEMVNDILFFYNIENQTYYKKHHIKTYDMRILGQFNLKELVDKYEIDKYNKLYYGIKKLQYLKNLKKYYNIILITARRNKENTMYMLNNNGLVKGKHYDDIIFDDKKIGFLKVNNIKYLVEDKLETCIKTILYTNTKPFLVKKPWNGFVEYNNLLKQKIIEPNMKINITKIKRLYGFNFQ